MGRLISPSFDSLEPSPLKTVVQRIANSVSEDWEIFINPYLNGERPECILLNPRFGIVLLEIVPYDENSILQTLNRFPKFKLIQELNSKNLNSTEYNKFKNTAREIQNTRRISADTAKKAVKRLQKNDELSDSAGQVIWKAYEPMGVAGELTLSQIRHKIYRLGHIQEALSELYCPRLGAKSNLGQIACLLIFSECTQDFIDKNFKNYWDLFVNSKVGTRHKYIGVDSIQDNNFLESQLNVISELGMDFTPELVKDLRNWLVEPFFAESDRKPIALDAKQMNLVSSSTQTGFRRIRGASGSGKSLVLASRAAILCSEGKRVLVVTYNITLIEYLRRLSARFIKFNLRLPASKSLEITYVNFHYLCKRLAVEYDAYESYKGLWKGSDRGGDKTRRILDNDLPSLILQIFQKQGLRESDKFDAILVDEGQDFLPLWWNLLRKLLKESGEMLLNVDRTQDLYQRSGSWTDKAMTGAGFTGEWASLEMSYRLPEEIRLLADVYASQHISGVEKQIPKPPEKGLFSQCQVRLVPSSDFDLVSEVTREALHLVTQTVDDQFAMTDVTILVPDNNIGLLIEKKIEAAPFKVKVISTFSEDENKRRSKKMAFSMQNAEIKITTIHSFKGWESRAIVLVVTDYGDESHRLIFYTGLTRVVSHERGSYLTIVSTRPDLDASLLPFIKDLN